MSFATPEQNVGQFKVQPGMTVADFGAGVGHYALPLTEMVGPSGMVYAVDIQKDLVGKIRSEAQQRDIDNIDVIWGDLETEGGSRIADDVVDVVVASNILFQVEYNDAFIREVKRVLKGGGHVVVIDWSGSFEGTGPPEDRVVSEEEAKQLFERQGFSIGEDLSVGSHHYGFIAHLS